MSNHDYKIVVTGDICINSLLWRTHQPNTQGLSWQDYPYVHNSFKKGKALLLAKLVTLSTQASVLSPQIQTADRCPPKDILLSTIELDRFPIAPDGKTKKKVYRVKEFWGFTGPSSGSIPKGLPIQNDDEDADIVIIDDENNGFHSNEEFWPRALKTTGKSPLVIYKINNPDSSTPLWKHIEKSHFEHTIIVINAEDLRAKGMNISKSLSWERTALDFVWQMTNNPNLDFLAKCHHLIIPFGLEGAIYYRSNDVNESLLYFLTNEFEGGFIKETQGKMFGLTSCFVAGLVRSIVSGMRANEELNQSIDQGIREGMVAAQKYFVLGFGEDPEKDPFPHPSVFFVGEHDFVYKEHIQDVLIRDSNNPNCQSCWYIINDKSSTSLAEIAYDIVKYGEESALKFIPIAQFGKLKTVDRTEIEAYRSIKNLIEEYVSAKNVVRPLSIAVAGGTSSTYQEFCGEDITDEKELKHFFKEFQSAKGPDFISRLRGYVNILGPNQTDERRDQLFIVRRAMLLRSLLERKAPHLINEKGEAQIDNGVIRALLKVPRYKHESRSMEAILEMSMLSKAKKWEQSHLPSMEQLKLHVDEEQFSRHLMRDAFFSEKIEKLARDLYNRTHPSLQLNIANLWETLSEEDKNLIREQVRHIPNALHKINYDVISVKEKPQPIEFTEQELRALAKYVHKRQLYRKKSALPLLGPWDDLSKDIEN